MGTIRLEIDPCRNKHSVTKFLEKILIYASLNFTFSPGFTNLVLRSLRLVLEVNMGTLSPEKCPEDPLEPLDLGLNP